MSMTELRDTWLMFQREHHCSIDRMLCNPILRNDYLAAARQVSEEQDELRLLWATVNLRKKKSLPRTER